MPSYTPPLRDMQFVLHEVLNVVDEFKALPRHADVVGALTDFDLVGFQTPNDRDNFARYLQEAGGVGRMGNSQFDINGRRVQLGAFPVGIDTGTMMKAARRASSPRSRTVEARLKARTCWC